MLDKEKLQEKLLAAADNAKNASEIIDLLKKGLMCIVWILSGSHHHAGCFVQ